MNVCRICLSEAVEKDITQLAEAFKGKNYADIMLFCLDIKVSPKSKLTTKLCIKCYENIISFYKFKNLAQKNHNLLQLRHGEKDDKREGSETKNIKSKENNNGTEDEINDTDESEKIEAKNKRNVKKIQPEYDLFNGIENVIFKYVPEAEEEDDWHSDCSDHLYEADLEDIHVTANAPGHPLFVGGALYPLESNFVGHSCLLETGNQVNCYRVRDLNSNEQSLNGYVRSLCVLLRVNNTHNSSNYP